MIIDYINAALGEGTYHKTSKGVQYSFCCPLCNDHKQRFFVNVDKQVFYCHNCGGTGSLITLISQYAHIPWGEALRIYRSQEGYSKPLPESLEDEIYNKLIHPDVDIKKYVYSLPEEFILIENATGKAGKQAIEYLKKRGVTLGMSERYYIGYCDEGKYANRIIMPDFENEELIYWQARTWETPPKNPIVAKTFRKVLNPSLTEEQVQQGVVAVDKSEVISNIDFILEEGTCILCEGKMDAYILGDIGGCTHGKVLSDNQFIKLVQNKHKIGCIAVMYDGDAFGSTITAAKRLYKHFDEVLVCRLPKDKDPNELGRKGCLQVLKDAIPYDPMFEIKAKLKGWL